MERGDDWGGVWVLLRDGWDRDGDFFFFGGGGGR